ncbi:hypothetical protein AVEN_240940-1 [Araneus ventricosus]|uniref:Uncharacterized protein n=1 Tax=Araneus ventricosus TaxID=182803 RepID=A0A4Y2JUK8_ARAVE|nr:hypothetical protein AVEN_240940-1 [Araneus ventricosus]
MMRKSEEVILAKVSSSSPHRGSKLRGQSQSVPRGVSKRDVNTFKLSFDVSSSARMVRKFEKVIPAQVSSSSPHRGSKLRGPSQSVPRGV